MRLGEGRIIARQLLEHLACIVETPLQDFDGGALEPHSRIAGADALHDIERRQRVIEFCLPV